MGLPSHCYVLEESIVNPIEKTATMKSINLTGTEFVSVEEIITYSAQMDNENHTLYDKWIRITGNIQYTSS